jgi:hypothetical protein
MNINLFEQNKIWIENFLVVHMLVNLQVNLLVHINSLSIIKQLTNSLGIH